jgi:geranylgeranyl diphosphate synthase, type II
MRFARLRSLIEARLNTISPSAGAGASRLCRSIRYSLLDGGKRLRPLATVLTAEALGAPAERALDVACAIEMVHTASLMIDDLPCMDDAQHRRGRPAAHLVHGEDIVILGAVALISEAFGVIGRSAALDPLQKNELMTALSETIGVDGLCAGQERDLREIRQDTDLEALEQLQLQKTGALFVLCLEAGARIAGLSGSDLAPLRAFGRHAGLAFQILDDLLDTAGTAASTGKDHGADRGKCTYAALLGVQDGHRKAHAELAAALAALDEGGVERRPFAEFLDLVLEAFHGQMAGNGSALMSAAP